MAELVHHLAQPFDVAGYPGGGLVMTGENSLDLVSAVAAQNVFRPLQGHPLTPLDLLDLDIEAQALSHVDPKVAELAKARRQHLVPR